MFFVFDFGRR